MLNQHKKYLKDRRYASGVLKRDKENLYGVKGVLNQQSFGEEYLQDFGKFRSSRTRLNQVLYLNFEKEQIENIQWELNMRRDLNQHRSGLSETSVEIDGKMVRVEKEILQDYSLLMNPGRRSLYNRRIKNVINKLKHNK